jgi:hypothetical protein
VNILEEANGLVSTDRQRDYGHPLDDFARTAALWTAILGFPIEPEQVGLCMAAVKISRECNRHKRDNLVDLAGYARTVELIYEERARRNKAEGGPYGLTATIGAMGRASLDSTD